MNKKEPVQRIESERRVKGEGDISGWKTEAFKCRVNVRQTQLIAITCFFIGARLPVSYVCFYFYQSGTVSEENGRITRVSSANCYQSHKRSTMNEYLRCAIVLQFPSNRERRTKKFVAKD